MLNANRFIEKELPDNHRVVVRHLHEGNSSSKDRKGFPYMTIAKVYTKDGTCLGEGKAMCARHDNPRRDVGRAIAVGRAMKDAYFSKVSQLKKVG